MSNKIQLTTVQTRTSETIEFFVVPKFVIDHQKKTYEDTKKIFKKNIWTSPDKLCKTTILHFSSTEDYQEFQNDNIREKTGLDRELHAIENGIGITLLIQEYNLEEGIVNSKVKVVTETFSSQGISSDVSLRGVAPSALRKVSSDSLFSEV